MAKFSWRNKKFTRDNNKEAFPVSFTLAYIKPSTIRNTLTLLTPYPICTYNPKSEGNLSLKLYKNEYNIMHTDHFPNAQYPVIFLAE